MGLRELRGKTPDMMSESVDLVSQIVSSVPAEKLAGLKTWEFDGDTKHSIVLRALSVCFGVSL